MTFYHTANASRSTKLADGRRVTFDVYKLFAGSWLGIAAVEDPKTIAGLDELVFKPKSGITRITEEEYQAHLQKKNPQRNSVRLTASPLLPPLQAALQLVGGPAGRPAAVVDNPKPTAPAVVLPSAPARVFESLDDVLQVGTVKTIDAGVTATKDIGERSDRQTGRPSRQPKYMSDIPKETT